MNKKQKIVFWLTIVIFIWIGFGGPYNAISYYTRTIPTKHKDLDRIEPPEGFVLDEPRKNLSELDFSESPKDNDPDLSEPGWEYSRTKICYCFDHFTEILRAWIVLVVPSAAIFYSFKTR